MDHGIATHCGNRRGKSMEHRTGPARGTPCDPYHVRQAYVLCTKMIPIALMAPGLATGLPLSAIRPATVYLHHNSQGTMESRTLYSRVHQRAKSHCRHLTIVVPGCPCMARWVSAGRQGAFGVVVRRTAESCCTDAASAGGAPAHGGARSAFFLWRASPCFKRFLHHV